MKLLNNTNTLELVNENESIEMGIDFTGKICSILSSSLYTNKISAGVRELSCNAVDAYDPGEKNKRYDIHLPSEMECYFYIRDYATGLSYDEMKTVYAHFGRSTKENSNDFVGCLGIGSKSPFAYVNNFTVISYYKGEQSTYNIFKNESGKPQFIKLNHLKTDELDGLKVQFTVKSYDIVNFQSAAISILKYFKHKPTLLNTNIKIPELEYKFKFEHFGITKDYCEKCIVMGNIAYPLKQFENKLDQEEEDEAKIKVLLKGFSNLIFFAPLGLFDFAPSRESISLDPQSFKNLKLYFLNCIEQLELELENILRDLEQNNCYFDALIKYNSYKIFHNYMSNIKIPKLYQNRDNCPYVNEILLKNKRVTRYHKELRGQKLIVKFVDLKYIKIEDFIPTKYLLLLVSNDTTYVKQRIRKSLIDSNKECAYVIYKNDYCKSDMENAKRLNAPYLTVDDFINLTGLTTDSLTDLNTIKYNSPKKSSVVYDKGKVKRIQKRECRGFLYDIKNKECLYNTVIDLNDYKVLYYVPHSLKNSNKYRDMIVCSGDIFVKSMGLKKTGYIFIPERDSYIKKLKECGNSHDLTICCKSKIGLEHYYLWVNSNLLSEKDKINNLNDMGLIKHYDKFIYLNKEKEKYFNLLRFVFGRFIYTFNKNIEVILEEIREMSSSEDITVLSKVYREMGMGILDNRYSNPTDKDIDQFNKILSFYYQHHERDIAKPIDDLILEMYEKYTKILKDFCCFLA